MKLTAKQQRLIDLLKEGKEQEEAYRIAYRRLDFTDGQARKALSNVWKSKKMKLAKLTLCEGNKEIISKKEIVERLVKVQELTFQELQSGKIFGNTLNAFFFATQELNKMLCYYSEIEIKRAALEADIQYRKERLEFDKSKIAKDNEELQKENASLLRSLISKKTENAT